MARILIVEDDDAIAELERDYLEMAGHAVTIERDGRAGLTLGVSGDFDLVLLDVMLPGMDGMEVCRALRAQCDIPILMCTARTDDIDKIRGLGLGADDYVEKPFSPGVLLARVQAHLQRYARLTGGSDAEASLEVGRLRIDVPRHEVSVAGVPVELRAREFDLLVFLARHPGALFDRDALYERVWGAAPIGDEAATVTVHIKRIRAALERAGGEASIIQTVRGVGYRLRSS